MLILTAEIWKQSFFFHFLKTWKVFIPQGIISIKLCFHKAFFMSLCHLRSVYFAYKSLKANIATVSDA